MLRDILLNQPGCQDVLHLDNLYYCVKLLTEDMIVLFNGSNYIIACVTDSEHFLLVNIKARKMESHQTTMWIQEVATELQAKYRWPNHSINIQLYSSTWCYSDVYKKSLSFKINYYNRDLIVLELVVMVPKTHQSPPSINLFLFLFFANKCSFYTNKHLFARSVTRRLNTFHMY